MKTVSAFIVLWMSLVYWIGNQLHTTIAERYASQTSDTGIGQRASFNKIQALHMTLYVKEIDSDDLLEFTSSPDHSNNEIGMNILTGYVLDRATNENKHVTCKFFNDEYDGKPDNRLTKYPGADSYLEQQDRYLLKIPIVFLSPKAHPPQHIG